MGVTVTVTFLGRLEEGEKHERNGKKERSRIGIKSIFTPPSYTHIPLQINLGLQYHQIRHVDNFDILTNLFTKTLNI